MTGPEADKGLIAIDVGGGTQDVFVYVPGQSFENCPKMVMPSPTRVVAEKIARATEGKQPVFLSGEIMGGGSCAGAADGPVHRHRPRWPSAHRQREAAERAPSHDAGSYKASHRVSAGGGPSR